MLSPLSVQLTNTAFAIQPFACATYTTITTTASTSKAFGTSKTNYNIHQLQNSRNSNLSCDCAFALDYIGLAPDFFQNRQRINATHKLSAPQKQSQLAAVQWSFLGVGHLVRVFHVTLGKASQRAEVKAQLCVIPSSKAQPLRHKFFPKSMAVLRTNLAFRSLFYFRKH